MSILDLFNSDSLGRYISEFFVTPKYLFLIRLSCQEQRFLEPYQKELIEIYARNAVSYYREDMWVAKNEISLENSMVWDMKYLHPRQKAYWNLFEIKCILKLPDFMVK